MASDSIDINIEQKKSKSEDELVSAIKSLTGRMGNFESSIKDLASKLSKISSSSPKNSKGEASIIANANARQKRYEYLSSPNAETYDKNRLSLAKQRNKSQELNNNKLAIQSSLGYRKSIEAESQQIMEKTTLTRVIAKQRKETEQSVAANKRLDKQIIGIKQRSVNRVLAQAEEQGKLGNVKEQLRLNELATNMSTGKGVATTNKNSNRELMRSMFSYGGAIYGASVVGNEFQKHFQTQGNIASAGLTNPYENYDFGSQLSNISNARNDATNAKNTGIITAVATAVTTTIGAMVGGSKGAAAGFGIGSTAGLGAGEVYASYQNSKTKPLNEIMAQTIDQKLQAKSLKDTNYYSYNNMQNSKRYMNSGKNETERSSFVLAPTIKEVAKGTSVYNKNYREMDKLTDYIVRARVPMSKIAEYTSKVAEVGVTGKDMDRMFGLSNTYGISADAIADRTIKLMQGGLSRGQALEVAGSSFNSTSGFQDRQMQHVQQGYLERANQEFIFKQFTGKDLFVNGKLNEPELEKLHKSASSINGYKNITPQNLQALEVLNLTSFAQSTRQVAEIESRAYRPVESGIGQENESMIKNLSIARLGVLSGSANLEELTKSADETSKSLISVTSKANDLMISLESLNEMVGKLTMTVEQQHYTRMSGSTIR
jgi:hypothetical protein